MSRTVTWIVLVSSLIGSAAVAVAGPAGETAAATESSAMAEASDRSGPIAYASPAAYRAATGMTLPPYGEAPMLAELVSQGVLEPVEQRLPQEPVVVQPVDQIGTYGGQLRQPGHRPIAFLGWKGRVQNLFRLSYQNGFAIEPNIALSYELSEDFTRLTVRLRPGMRWSDGEPFTAADLLFWFDSIIGNDELTPAKPKNLSPGGELMQVRSIDSSTVVFSFSQPYPVIVDFFAALSPRPYAPRHYLEQYHVDHSEDAAAKAQSEGYENWFQAFQFHYDVEGGKQVDAELPVLDAWALDRIDSFENKYLVRNPYYWKVDTAGNQLPYYDEQMKMFVSDPNAIELKAMAGEFSTSGLYLRMENMPLYRENEQEGNYRIIAANGLNSGIFGYSFNLTHPDPVLREIFGDLRFRQAMSLAIDRDELNNTFYFGEATPSQATVLPDSAFWERWMGEYYTDYDPAAANALLDEMGLELGAGGIRLRPDGEPLAVILEECISVWGGPKNEIDQLLKEYWGAVGVDVSLKTVSCSLFRQHAANNELDIPNWATGGFYDVIIHSNQGAFLPPWSNFGAGLLWAQWWSSDGASGEEPPAEVKELYDLADQFKQTLTGSDEYLRVGKELVSAHLRGLYTIGTVCCGRWPMLVSNNVGNYLRGDPPWGHQYGHWGLFEIDQWFELQ